MRPPVVRLSVRTTLAFTILVAMGLAPAPADACIHGPRLAAMQVEQLGQQAVILHHAGREDLVLSLNYSTDSPAQALALVLPVPSVPDDYGLGDPALFRQVARWLLPSRPQPRSAGGAKKKKKSKSAASPGIEILDAHSVGPFEIQPIRGVGQEGAAALETWMSENGFRSAAEEELRYYVDRGWTFLAVKIVPTEGALATRGSLPPLRVSFASELIVYPLKLELTSEFPFALTIISDREILEQDTSEAKRVGLKQAGVSPIADGSTSPEDIRISSFNLSEAPTTLDKLLRESKFVADSYSIAVFRGHWYGDIYAKRPEDLSFPGLPEGVKLTATTQVETPPAQSPKVATKVAAPAGSPDAAGTVDPPSAPGGETTPTEKRGCTIGGRGGGNAGTWLGLIALVRLGARRRRRAIRA